MTDIQRVQRFLDVPELLCQLAEECSELAKAASKVRRIMTKKNPVTMTYGEAWDNLMEEVADIMLVLECLGVNPNCQFASDIKKEKLTRWIGKLENR